ncbi:hypothetical protein K458DRAFT_450017 [Lentithecium fluviatile CBS 122367]|uniref:Uncharacterized protein n=1 Tax=Lentithecium fluviatile CBS 122367 TaxID=1168545 RepID=A0A6G1J4L7_9PLEO|nr:hypothetical protein K458DRAFT_450017 [Lentithecium fluviatile CBS 122367]
MASGGSASRRGEPEAQQPGKGTYSKTGEDIHQDELGTEPPRGDAIPARPRDEGLYSSRPNDSRDQLRRGHHEHQKPLSRGSRQHCPEEGSAYYYKNSRAGPVEVGVDCDRVSETRTRRHDAYPDEREHGSRNTTEPLSYAELMNVALDLQNEVKRLAKENDGLQEAQKDGQRQQKEIVRLSKTLDAVQREALSHADKFQLKFDESIIDEFSKVHEAMKPALSMLVKQKPDLAPDRWGEAARKLMRSGCEERPTKALDYVDKTMRKKMLRAIVWKWLELELFASPFQAFGVSKAEVVKACYKCLWEDSDGDEEAAKWRSLSGARLATASENDHATSQEVHSRVLESFGGICEELGYLGLKDIKDGTKKMAPLIDAAIVLARSFSAQRAVFRLTEPSQSEKDVEDDSVTTVDQSFEEEEEKAGRICYVSRPGLVKWGTGSGADLKAQTILIKAVVELE